MVKPHAPLPPPKRPRPSSRLSLLPTAAALLQEFETFLDLDVANGDAAEDTVNTYLRRVKQYLRWCEEQGINAGLVTATEIKQYRRYLIQEKQQKSATIALTLVVLRRFYGAALVKGLVSENPVLGIKPPRDKVDAAERLTYLEVEQLQQLLAIVPKDRSIKSQRDLTLIALMALQGPRTVELHRANVRDLVRAGSNWGLRVEGKGSVRTIPLRADLAKQLWDYLEAREREGDELTPESPLFIAVGNRFGGERLSRRGIRWIVDSYLQAAGLKHLQGRTLSTHSLRHTAGTLGLRAGADLRQIQDLLGHKDPKTTALYAHVNDRHEHNPALGIEVEF